MVGDLLVLERSWGSLSVRIMDGINGSASYVYFAAEMGLPCHVHAVAIRASELDEVIAALKEARCKLLGPPNTKAELKRIQTVAGVRGGK